MGRTRHISQVVPERSSKKQMVRADHGAGSQLMRKAGWNAEAGFFDTPAKEET